MNTNKQWLESRQNYLTASDCLFVLSEFNEKLKDKLADVETYSRTRFQLYYEKVMDVERYLEYQGTIANDFMQEGKDREAEIAGYAENNLGLKIEPNGNNLVVKEEYRIGATPDYYVNEVDAKWLADAVNATNENVVIDGDFSGIEALGKGILECKLTGELTEDKFSGYESQVQHQLLCAGLPWAVIAVAVKESRSVGSPVAKRHYRFIKANKNFQQAIIDSCNAFWKWFDAVKSGTEETPKPNTNNEKDKILNTFLENDIAVLCEKYMELYIAYQACDVSFEAVKDRLKLYGKGETFEITISDGTKYRIPISKTKDTIWTEDLKQEEIKKITDAPVGSVRRKGSMSIGKPKLI